MTDKQIIIDGWANVNNQILMEVEQMVDRMGYYKQTLAGIKEIAEKHKATAHCDYLTDMDKILQKISEVIDE